jgi:hypothetical protein
MEALSDIDGDVVDAVLHGALTKGGKHLRHLATVVGGHLFRLQPQLLTALEIDEEMGTGVIVEVHLVGHVIGVKDNDFVLVMPQVPQGIEEGFLLVRTYEDVGEEDNKRALVKLLCGEVNGFRKRCFAM